jgi:hypothetical protein
MWKKFQDDHGYTWPPCHGFRESSNCTWITQIDALMTLPAAVEAQQVGLCTCILLQCSLTHYCSFIAVALTVMYY